jgi:hypothetical protein
MATTSKIDRNSDAYKRGQYDDARDKGPIFRNTSRGIEPTVDDDLADEWSEQARIDYLAGFYDE